MQIPQRLAYILERDQQLDGAVKLSISQFEPWIKHSNLPFFPEYTKHDIEHIEAVLKTASALIRDEAWNEITPSDAAVLILSILLHDCAMHVSEDGFFSLFEENRRDKQAFGMAEKPWHILWEDFFGEASRFDGRRLTRLFGDAQPVRKLPNNPNDLTKRDRLLVGEFLRRHHPRLAQEIAEFGVPTKGTNPLLLEGLSGEKNYVAKLSGIIARSHGEEIRKFLPFLEENFDIRQYKGVHSVFLMTLLRIGDYLQVDADRAPSQMLRVKNLASPVSMDEWKAHHAIKDVRQTHQDPEALFIDALPENVENFLKIESWRKGIQHELDVSWAVLGEVYGRYEGLNKLGLVLRRVRSSLDDSVAFSKKVSYLPRKATFRAADADLLKLLIEPLYGNKPEVGLRELIQNALDAVRELKQYRADIPNLGELLLTDQSADVVVSIDKISDQAAVVTISDKGIGMTPDIVTDYFLAAGASFRRSDDWRKQFETTEGKSKVLRAGRFGVGALASFLLGPEIEVTTRHVEEIEGIQFSATVASDSIELRKIKRPIGTTIRIQIPLSLATKLAKQETVDAAAYWTVGWDWYCLRQPSLKRLVFGQEIPQRIVMPDSEKELPFVWRKITHPDFSPLLWTYSNFPALTCNGIRIPSRSDVEWDTKFGLELPNINVFDPDGRLPLNLQRTELAEESFPFEDVLLEDVIRDFVAFALVYGPPTPPRDFSLHWATLCSYPGSARSHQARWGRQDSSDWFVTSDGFSFLDANSLKAGGYNSVLISRIAETNSEEIAFLPTREQPCIILKNSHTISSLDTHLRLIAELAYYKSHSAEVAPPPVEGGVRALEHLNRKGARFLISSFAFKRAASPKGPGRLPVVLKGALKPELTCNDWILVKMGDCPAPIFDFEAFMKMNVSKISNQSMISEVYLDSNSAPPQSPTASKWFEVLNSFEIPFDMKTRREKLKTAYESLAAYIQRHEQMKAAQHVEKLMFY